MSDKPPDTQLTVVHFLFQNIHACIELQYIDKVLPLPLLEAVPGSPAYLIGLMNLAGKSIPVIDLSLRLGMQRVIPFALDMPILLCSDGDQKTGIIIDKVLGLVNIEETELQMRHDFSKNESVFKKNESVFRKMNRVFKK